MTADSKLTPTALLRVSTGSRLHFGLVEIHEGAPNCYGGIGLMIEEPDICLEMDISPSKIHQLSIDAPSVWHERIEDCLKHWLHISGHSNLPVNRLKLVYDELPHQGLGSGTQISSIIASGLWAAQRWINHGERVRTEQCQTRDHLLPQRGNLGKQTLSSDEWTLKRPQAGSFFSESCGADFANLTLRSDLDVPGLSWISQRGLRSHIGLCGFLNGGLIYDQGENVGIDDALQTDSQPMGRGPEFERGRTELSRKILRADFPDWPIVLIQNPTYTGEHGVDEKEKFRQCASSQNFNRDRMIELIEDDLLLAAHERDWNRWDRCIGEYGQLAGMIFQSVQSGVFRTLAIRKVVERIHALGCQGACQSSWGPTVAVVAKDMPHAQYLLETLRHDFPELKITVTRPKNSGATFSLEVNTETK